MLRAVALVASISFAQSAHSATATVVAPFISVSATHVQANNRALSDSVELTDTLTLQVSVAFGDSVAMTDALALDAGVVFGDSVTLADSVVLDSENAAVGGQMVNERILNG